MRFVVNVLIALMLLGILAGVMVHRNVQQQQRQQLEQTRADTRRLQREVMLQATLRKVELSETGFPLTIDPKWFEDELPTNLLIAQGHPWVEIAHEDHRYLDHPHIKLATDTAVAAYWYNPYNGMVRARVPATVSDAVALEQYNFINEVNLPTLFEGDPLERLHGP